MKNYVLGVIVGMGCLYMANKTYEAGIEAGTKRAIKMFDLCNNVAKDVRNEDEHE